MNIELTDEERELASKILEERLGTLRQEIYHSTDTVFTGHLKATKAVLESLLAKIGRHAPEREPEQPQT